MTPDSVVTYRPVLVAHPVLGRRGFVAKRLWCGRNPTLGSGVPHHRVLSHTADRGRTWAPETSGSGNRDGSGRDLAAQQIAGDHFECPTVGHSRSSNTISRRRAPSPPIRTPPAGVCPDESVGAHRRRGRWYLAPVRQGPAHLDRREEMWLSVRPSRVLILLCES
jgi:hypothetical protein